MKNWITSLLMLFFVTVKVSSITTDSGCTCATIRSSISTPGIYPNLTIGCGNWYDRPSK